MSSKQQYHFRAKPSHQFVDAVYFDGTFESFQAVCATFPWTDPVLHEQIHDGHFAELVLNTDVRVPREAWIVQDLAGLRVLSDGDFYLAYKPLVGEHAPVDWGHLVEKRV